MDSVSKTFLPLGFVTFGGPASNVALFERLFVDKFKTITADRFAELLAICSTIPGSTSAQMSAAIGGSMAGPLGSIAAFLLFTWPGLLLMLFAGKYLNLATQITDKIEPQWIFAAAMSVILIATITLYQKVVSTTLSTILAVISAAIALSVPFIYFPLIPITSAIIAVLLTNTTNAATRAAQFTLLTGDPHSAQKLNLNHAMIALGILVLAGTGFFFLSEASAAAMSGSEGNLLNFFLSGASVYGGGNSVIPYLQTMIRNKDFLLLFSLALLSPGPITNMAAGVGVIVGKGSLLYGLSAWGALMLPGFLTAIIAVPVWQSLRGKFEILNRALLGMNAAAVGLMFAAAIQLWIGTIGLHWTRILAVFAGLAFQAIWEVEPVFIVLLGLLGGVIQGVFLTGTASIASVAAAGSP
jgi:chromate transporter